MYERHYIGQLVWMEAFHLLECMTGITLNGGRAKYYGLRPRLPAVQQQYMLNILLHLSHCLTDKTHTVQEACDDFDQVDRSCCVADMSIWHKSNTSERLVLENCFSGEIIRILFCRFMLSVFHCSGSRSTRI